MGVGASTGASRHDGGIEGTHSASARAALSGGCGEALAWSALRGAGCGTARGGPTPAGDGGEDVGGGAPAGDGDALLAGDGGAPPLAGDGVALAGGDGAPAGGGVLRSLINVKDDELATAMAHFIDQEPASWYKTCAAIKLQLGLEGGKSSTSLRRRIEDLYRVEYVGSGVKFYPK